MARFYEMPQASPTMEFGVLLSWKVAEGAKLAPQDVIAEVETDKAAMDIEVFDPGYMLKLLASEGDEICIRAGTDNAATVVEITQEFWEGITNDLESAPGLLYGGDLGEGKGDMMRFVAWEPAFAIKNINSLPKHFLAIRAR